MVNQILLDFDDLNNISFPVKIETPYGEEFNNLKLMAATKPITAAEFDFVNQYQIKEYTEGGTYTISIDDIVNGIDIYNSTADIQKYDMFYLFVNIETTDGKMLYGILPYEAEVFEGMTIPYGYDANTRANPDFNFEIKCIFY